MRVRELKYEVDFGCKLGAKCTQNCTQFRRISCAKLSSKCCGINGGDDGAPTPDLFPDSEKEGRNLHKTSVPDGVFWRCKERSGTIIEPIPNPPPPPSKTPPPPRTLRDEPL